MAILKKTIEHETWVKEIPNEKIIKVKPDSSSTIMVVYQSDYDSSTIICDSIEMKSADL